MEALLYFILLNIIDSCVIRYDNIVKTNFDVTFILDLVEVVYYLKQVFHLLSDKSATPAESLLYLVAA